MHTHRYTYLMLCGPFKAFLRNMIATTNKQIHSIKYIYIYTCRLAMLVPYFITHIHVVFLLFSFLLCSLLSIFTCVCNFNVCISHTQLFSFRRAKSFLFRSLLLRSAVLICCALCILSRLHQVVYVCMHTYQWKYTHNYKPARAHTNALSIGRLSLSSS